LSALAIFFSAMPAALAASLFGHSYAVERIAERSSSRFIVSHSSRRVIAPIASVYPIPVRSAPIRVQIHPPSLVAPR
jgi:hypothetical protein